MKGRAISLGAWLLAAVLSPEVRADGGTLRLRQRAGNYQVAVFTSPAVFRVGPVDVSVLVQDAATGEYVPQSQVTVRMTHDETASELEYPATVGAATNKLFHAAEFDLPRSGRWDVVVRIEGPRGTAQVRCEVDAAEPLPRWLEVWPWIAWPAVVIVLFGLHQLLVRRTSRRAITAAARKTAAPPPGAPTGPCRS